MNRKLGANVGNRCLDALRRFWRAEEGISVVLVGLALLAILGFAGIAVDGSNVFFQQQRLQIAADAAALGGARLLAKGANTDAVDVHINTIARANSADSTEWTLINDGKGVAVVALRDVETFFATLYGYDSFRITADANAQFEPVSTAYDLFPLTLGCDCVEDGMLTLVGDDPVESEETLDETGPMTVTVGLDDNKDTAYLISYLGRAGNTWTYFISELQGRDLASWGLGIESCLDEIQDSSPASATVGAGGFDGIKWEVDGAFSSGIFSFELSGVYPLNITQAVVKTSNNKSMTADIIGPDCSGGTVVEEAPLAPIDGMCLPTIDFETDDAGISLVSGQVIDDELEGWGVHVTTDNAVDHPAMIFDSANPTGGDWDLGTANEDFGGPGQGAGGRAGTPGENSQALGKLLIVSEDNNASDPDDNATGGTMSFTFDMPIRLDEIHVVDIKDVNAIAEFRAYSTQDTSNLIASTTSLALGNNSFQVVPINAAGVSRLDVIFPRTGAIESIVSCRSAPDVMRAIGDLIWADSNDNGVQESEEVGIPGVELELYLTGGDHVVARTITDLNGEYTFRNLPPGGSAVYDVKIADVNFAAGGVLEAASYSAQDEGGDEMLDSDFDSGTGRAVVTISEEGGDNLDIDGGFVLESAGLPTFAVLNIPGNDGDVQHGQGCAADVAGFDLNCTANDISLFGASNILIWDDENGNEIPGEAGEGCISQDDTVSFTADFEVRLTATARYDLGIWFAEDGDPNGDGAVTGTCTVATPPYAPDLPWVDLDGVIGGVQDICGDIDDAHSPLFPTITLTVKCSDPDGDGKLNIPYVTSWGIAGDNELCTSALGATPSTPSKCKSDTGFQVDIDVPLVTTSTTTPTTDPCTTFRWVDWNGGTTTNIELKQNMESTMRSGVWQIADLIANGPEMSTNTLVQAGLSSQMGERVLIPLSDETENGNDVCGFSEVRLVSYTTSSDRHFLTLEFLKDAIRSLGTNANLPDYGARDIVMLK